MPESPTKSFSGIFISYRRDDSSGHAGRLSDKLVDHFGKDRIFMDIDNIEPGEDFVTVIENAVGSCEILVAVIGRNWLSGSSGATGRLDNPNDFVRLEIAAALERDIRVIPVLVQRATMPKQQDLPESLAKLARRNAVELTDVHWQSDVGQLIRVMERVLANREEAASLAEAARQEEEEGQRLAEEEKRRVAEKERAQANAEARRRAGEEAEARRVEAEREAERRLEEAKQARAEKEPRQEAEEAERRRVEQVSKASRDAKQSKLDLPAVAAIPIVGHAAQLPARGDITGATPRRGRSRRPMLFIIIAGIIIIACVALLATVALIWMRKTPEPEQQSTNHNAGTKQTGKSTSATTAIPQPPAGMVYVPGGEFMMGRNGNDPMEAPAHKVTVKPFFVDMYEVTCEEYKKFLDANPDQVAPPDWVNRNYPAGSARKPVTGVDWDHANAYAAWSSKRLPSEEEWEFAARGTDGRLYPWGNNWKAGLANTGKPEAGDNDGALGMKEVGSYQGRSPYGVFDMIGNAWEWTASDLKVYPGGALGSPVDQSRDFKVIRGGSWTSRNDLATATYRRGYGARGEKLGYSYTGFRLVKDIANGN